MSYLRNQDNTISDIIYLAKTSEGKLIAFSTNIEYLFIYLKDFYEKIKSNDKYGEIVLDRIFDDDEKNKFYIENEDYILLNFWGNVILTNWEIEIYDEYFYNRYNSIKQTMLEITKRRIQDKYDDVDDDMVLNYLQRNLGAKYASISSYDRFMLNMDDNEVKDVINSSTLDSYMYDLNKEYKRKISDDK